MPNTPQNLVIKTLAKGATAQLREVVDLADRETVRPIYDELLRIAAKMARKHGFNRRAVKV